MLEHSRVGSAEHHAFLAAATAWSKRQYDAHAARMLASPLSGVPNEVACAYVALARREGELLDMIAHERLAVRPEARASLIAFGASLRRLADLPASADDAQRADAAAHSFRLAASPVAAREPAPGAQIFTLQEPASVEPADAVRAHNPRFSASQLNTYAECARKWYYRYLCGAVEDKGSSASFYGTAFHAALEGFHGEFPEPGNADPAVLERKLQAYINTSFERDRNNFQTAVEHELQVRRARRTARRYVEWLVAEARRCPFTVVGCELSTELQLEGFDFVGYIDRLDRDNATGAVAVVDYKTGSIATSAAEYRDKVRQFKDFQLPFYYWARTMAGDRVTRLALIPLKDALLDVRPISLEVVPVPRDVMRSQNTNGVIPIGELEAARERMIALCRELTSGQTTVFAVTSDPEACTYCAYNMACIGRPHPVEQRFAR